MQKLDPNKYVVTTTDKDMHVLFLSGNDGHTAPAFIPLSDDVIQFRTHEDAAYASKSMWENYHNGGSIWKVSHLYLDPYYKNPMYNGVCKNNFSERLRKCFSDSEVHVSISNLEDGWLVYKTSEGISDPHSKEFYTLEEAEDYIDKNKLIYDNPHEYNYKG